ncbi:MAG: hypothetical protein AB8G96_11305 [Phycisphaerales bacterium]
MGRRDPKGIEKRVRSASASASATKANADAPDREPTASSVVDASGADLRRRHIRFGWILLCVFLPLGLVLEALHGFKYEFYLGPQHETRRLLWTLAHAHGTLLSLANIGFGVLSGAIGLRGALASRVFMAGTVLLPVGFFAGGVVTYDGDPGPSVVLAPVGAALLVAALIMFVPAIWRATAKDG